MSESKSLGYCVIDEEQEEALASSNKAESSNSTKQLDFASEIEKLYKDLDGGIEKYTKYIDETDSVISEHIVRLSDNNLYNSLLVKEIESNTIDEHFNTHLNKILTNTHQDHKDTFRVKYKDGREESFNILKLTEDLTQLCTDIKEKITFLSNPTQDSGI
jgi:hypothetical protein